MTPKFWKFEIFENIDAGGPFGQLICSNFLAGANFNASRRRAFSCKWLVEWLHRRVIPGKANVTRRVVTPKSYCTSRGDCPTKPGHGISGVANLKSDFRCWNKWIPGNSPTQAASICLNFIFPKYELWALRNEKVIRCHATGSMRPKFWNFFFFFVFEIFDFSGKSEFDFFRSDI